MKTNYVKAEIDKILENSKCKLRRERERERERERDETGNQEIKECNKLSQMKYKSKHDWVGKVI